METIRVLIVEDNPGDVRLAKEAMAEAQFVQFDVQNKDRLGEAIAFLKQNQVDVILLDLGLPDSQGLETFATLYKNMPHIPILIYSGLADEKRAIEAVQMGAQAYLMKTVPLEGKWIILELCFAVERKKLTEMIVKRNAAVESSELKSHFLAGMSHEIRTPMYGLVGMIELLARTSLNKEQTEYLETMSQSAKILIKILDDIIDLSMIESGKVVLREVDFDLQKEVDEVVKLFEPQAKIKQLSLNCDRNAIPQFLHADPTRIRQVLTNLVSNALKFTEKGEVEISIEQKGENLRFAVKDTGPGISPQNQELLFTTVAPIRKGQSGAGLGLAISRQLVDLMHGHIGVESQEGKGSTFWFEIPFRKAEEKKEEKAAAAGEVPKGLKVLVAEDNLINQKVLGLQLSTFGCLTDFVSNGNEALDKVAKEKYDIILLDCLMPELDGFGAAQEIRRRPGPNQHTFIVALTASAMQDDREKCLAAGMDDYLAKPISINELQLKLSQCPLR